MGLRSPLWLWAAGLLAPLIVLYILKARREDREIPSTRLWVETMRVLDARVPFRRLRRDWLLLLQILIVCALVLAAAGPYRSSPVLRSGRAAIVVDASASLLAGGRMERAVREVRRILDGMGPGHEVAILRAGSETQVLAPLTSDRRVLGEALAGLAAEPAPADLGAALQVAKSLVGQEGDLILVSDVSCVDPMIEGLQIRRVGSPLPNSAIVAMGVRRSDPSGRDHEVFVRVRNASGNVATGTLQLLAAGSIRDAASISVEPHGEASATLDLVGLEEGDLEVRWTAGAPDDLPEDDRAFWVLRRPEQRRFRLSGGVDPFLLHALGALEGWREAAAGETADLEILVQRSPAQDGPPFLWIDPQELHRSQVEGARVLDWNRVHPALRHVDLHPVRFGRIPVVRRPSGAKILASSTAGPMILEGVHGDRRYLAWAFEPMETDLPLSVAFPVLVHNAMEHLAPPSATLEGGVATGEAPVIPWPDPEPAELITPSGKRRSVRTAGGMLHLPAIDETGYWRLESEGRTLKFAASLSDEAESNLQETGSGLPTAPAGPEREERFEAGIQDLWKPLALAALLFLLVEGWAFHRRWLA